MKVTPVNRKFGKYSPGEEFEFPDKAARVYIKAGKLLEVTASVPEYETRMMQAAPYGYKADGTPRRRPGRAVSEE